MPNYFLSGAFSSAGDSNTAAKLERQALANTPEDAYFLWMVGQRLQNIGMAELAEKSFARAIELNLQLKARRILDLPTR